jgi:molybdenum cofactor cytidylyltransferase
LARSSGAKPVENDDPEAEQIDSLRVGLDALGEGTEAAVVLPVDTPGVSVSTVLRVTAAFRRSRSLIVRPEHGGRPGHPILFARAVWGDLKVHELAEGARTVVRRYSDEIEDVPVDDPNVLVDIDTPERYAREIEHP